MHNGDFYALLFQMKNIARWGLMYNTRTENLSEHSMECAVLAHALALIGNAKFQKKYDANRILSAALYHDMNEVLTGDLPTPVKYYNEEIKRSYKEIEGIANKKLISMLPEALQEDYRALIEVPADSYEHILVKAADKISAYIKCIEELRSGNREFSKAESALKKEIDAYLQYPEVAYFCETFLDTFTKTLDELD